MKRFLWPALCLTLAAWAAFATWKWRQSTGPAPRSPVFADEAVADLERLTFQRQFAEQLLNYDSGSYWRNQTALAFLMATPLREQKLKELEDQADKRRQTDFRQQAQLTRISRRSSGFLWQGSLEGKEASRPWLLDFAADVELRETSRTLENPWGLEVTRLRMQSSPRKARPADRRLFLETGKATVVSFPCLVENVSTPENAPLKIKITSLRTSEIQFVSADDLRTLDVVAFCSDLKFPLSLARSSAENGADLFLRLAREDGSARFEKAKAARRAKESYQKTLEDELGFVIED